MSILIDETKKVLVQGITGREGKARAKLMMGYGTNVVAGCTPGKGGIEVEGVPVFDTVEEAVEHAGGIDISVIFVPAPLVKGAALEAFDAGIKLVVIVPDRVPVYDVMEISRKAKECGAKFIGPNNPWSPQSRKGSSGYDGWKGRISKTLVQTWTGGHIFPLRRYHFITGLLSQSGGYRPDYHRSCGRRFHCGSSSP